MESILGLCCAQNVPQRMLSWHYRSRHHSLIAVSNQEFYDGKLYVIPSPGQPGRGQGLSFDHVPDGIFDRGRSASNRREAQVVAEAVMEHARRHPLQTLGVGTFSVSQRDAILNELELLRRADPSCEEFFVSGTAEPFFVKNLENIQGDERDVIFISVGYGKTAEGYMAMSFGPLSNEGGERRLNVLITRARESCRVFSSIRAHDIDLGRTQARGTAALKTFLTYAESGVLDAGQVTGRDYDSEFERQVGRALSAHGFQVDPQIGVAGFFLDLAVRDPEQPGRHLLGVECDGANYHRSRSARDRDRLRQAVLESRGWIIHRVWSTDWFHRPEDELRKLLAAIERAQFEWGRREQGATAHLRSATSTEMAAVTRRQEPASPEVSGASPYPTRPYQVASFRVSGNRELHRVRPHELARVVTKIVEVEGPIHREEIVRRVTQLYGLQRAGRRVREAVEAALENAARKAVQQQDSDFYAPQDLVDVPIRDRGDVPSNTLRRPEMLPPAEIREAMTAVVRVHYGMTRDESITETARLFGFRTTSAPLRQVLERELAMLLEGHYLEERNGKIYVRQS
jgi:very-short-patch-repair endonuclease